MKTLKTILIMGLIVNISALTIYLSCSDSSQITNNPGEKQNPLIEGKSYYLDQSGICSISLGEYRLVNGNVTFTDSLTGNVFTIKLIEKKH